MFWICQLLLPDMQHTTMNHVDVAVAGLGSPPAGHLAIRTLKNSLVAEICRLGWRLVGVSPILPDPYLHLDLSLFSRRRARQEAGEASGSNGNCETVGTPWLSAL